MVQKNFVFSNVYTLNTEINWILWKHQCSLKYSGCLFFWLTMRHLYSWLNSTALLSLFRVPIMFVWVLLETSFYAEYFLSFLEEKGYMRFPINLSFSSNSKLRAWIFPCNQTPLLSRLMKEGLQFKIFTCDQVLPWFMKEWSIKLP